MRKSSRALFHAPRGSRPGVMPAIRFPAVAAPPEAERNRSEKDNVMIYQEKTYWAAEGPVPEPAKGRKGFIRRLISAPLSHWQRRKTIAALHQLSDATLADLGMSRGQIPDVVDGLIASGLTAASLRDVVTPRDRADA
jgi:uncharacterized protein YjiS (DUF1127 family)